MAETKKENKKQTKSNGHTEVPVDTDRRTPWKHLNLPSGRAQTESNWMYILPQTANSSLCTRKRRPRHRRNRTDQRYDTGSIERIKSQHTRRTIGNLSHSNSGRSTGDHAHHRYDGKHRTKEQHLLLSGNGRENPETGKRNEHGRPADLFLL